VDIAHYQMQEDRLHEMFDVMDSTCLSHLQISGVSIRFPEERLIPLTCLVTLDLSECPGLRSLPEGIAVFKSLRTLNLQKCGNLCELPDGICALVSLVTLDLGICTSLGGLPEDLGNLPRLAEISLCLCEKLFKLPGSLCRGANSLRVLDLRLCPAASKEPELKAELRQKGCEIWEVGEEANMEEAHVHTQDPANPVHTAFNTWIHGNGNNEPSTGDGALKRVLSSSLSRTDRPAKISTDRPARTLSASVGFELNVIDV